MKFTIFFAILLLGFHTPLLAINEVNQSCQSIIYPFLKSPIKLLKNHSVAFDMKNGIKIFTPEERKNHTIYISRNGLFVDANGVPFSTDDARIIVGDEIVSTQLAIFVLSKEGDLVISNYSKFMEIHHTSLVAGDDVWFAGEIRIHNGILMELNNYSGHYQTHERYLEKLLAYFKERNVHIKNYSTRGYDEKVTLIFDD